jgi:hypothetical protein
MTKDFVTLCLNVRSPYNKNMGIIAVSSNLNQLHVFNSIKGLTSRKVGRTSRLKAAVTATSGKCVIIPIHTRRRQFAAHSLVLGHTRQNELSLTANHIPRKENSLAQEHNHNDNSASSSHSTTSIKVDPCHARLRGGSEERRTYTRRTERSTDRPARTERIADRRPSRPDRERTERGEEKKDLLDDLLSQMEDLSASNNGRTGLESSSNLSDGTVTRERAGSPKRRRQEIVKDDGRGVDSSVRRKLRSPDRNVKSPEAKTAERRLRSPRKASSPVRRVESPVDPVTEEFKVPEKLNRPTDMTKDKRVKPTIAPRQSSARSATTTPLTDKPKETDAMSVDSYHSSKKGFANAGAKQVDLEKEFIAMTSALESPRPTRERYSSRRRPSERPGETELPSVSGGFLAVASTIGIPGVFQEESQEYASMSRFAPDFADERKMTDLVRLAIQGTL